MVNLTPFGAYTLLQLAVGLSRVFVLAHFPHQVVGGILAGEWENFRSLHPEPNTHPWVRVFWAPSPSLKPPPSSISVPQSACSCCPGAALGWGLQARTPPTCTSGFFMATALALLLSSLALHSLVITAGIDIDW